MKFYLKNIEKHDFGISLEENFAANCHLKENGHFILLLHHLFFHKPLKIAE